HGKNDVIKGFRFTPGANPPLGIPAELQSTVAYIGTSNPDNSRGANPIISANGSSNGIVWDIGVDDASDGAPLARLYAYNASNLAKLYSSDQNPNDDAGPGQNFISPTVANGKVYVATRAQVTIYGLKAYKTAQAPTIQFGVNPTSGAAPLAVTAST